MRVLRSWCGAALVIGLGCGAEPVVPELAIDRIVPAAAPSTTAVAVQIEGTFHLPITSSLDQQGTIVALPGAAIGDTALEGASWRGEQMIEGAVPAGLAPGLYDVAVTLGGQSATLPMGYEVIDDTPPPPAAPFSLSGVDWLLPCITNDTPNITACTCSTSALVQSRTIGGNPGERWHVTVRIRGVMEHMDYVNGTAGIGGWYVGGAPIGGGNNYYKLSVSAPAAVFYINSGVTSQSNSWPTDYEAKFDLEAGATLTFEASGQDGIQWEGVDANDVAISIAGITDPPQPYNGQFAQMDVLAAVPF